MHQNESNIWHQQTFAFLSTDSKPSDARFLVIFLFDLTLTILLWCKAVRWAINHKFRSMTLLESINSNFLPFKMGSMTFWSCLFLVFWMKMQRYWKWSVSLFSTACYNSKIKAAISRFVIQEGRMILPRFLAANIPDIPLTLLVT